MKEKRQTDFYLLILFILLILSVIRKETSVLTQVSN
jgi:hypothetical protein